MLLGGYDIGCVGFAIAIRIDILREFEGMIYMMMYGLLRVEDVFTFYVSTGAACSMYVKGGYAQGYCVA